MAYVTLGVVALGEIIQSPRYYEYISRLAPPGQQGTYMGFAFLPIGIGSLIAGWFGGKLIHHFGEVTHQPEKMWWAVIAVGLKKEGIALHDPQGLFKTLLSQPFIPNVDVARELSAQRAKLAPYSDPRRFNNNFLFCLSHLYSIGKGVIMLGLAKRGILEFNRDAAFRRFAALNPDLAKETEKVAQLRPFYRLVTKRQREPLPFPYESANHQLQEAVAAIETLARRTETL
jgi:MFS family permease